MTQREKLIELIEERRAYQWQNAKGVINSAPIIICLEDIVDYLIANGVVALPCKVGDTLWSASPFTDGKVREGYISAFFVDEGGAYGFSASFGVEPVSAGFLIDEIGMTVFFTKEEAEIALAKRKGGDE